MTTSLPAQEHTSNWGLAAMLLGLGSLAFFWVPYFGVIIGIIAIALSLYSINTPGRLMAIIGLVAGIGGAALGLLTTLTVMHIIR